jgi:hypothetical protein
MAMSVDDQRKFHEVSRTARYGRRSVCTVA